MKNFEFCYIAPTNYLHLIPQQSRRHLILAHLLKDETYAAFYRDKRARGDIIICDNGAFELGQSLPPNQLLDLIDQSGINPQYIVAPDYPNQPWYKTYSAAVEFVEIVKDRYASTREVLSREVSMPHIMAVPQSEQGDYKGWIKSYQLLSKYDGIDMIGMSILGIPNAFKALTLTDDIAFNRIYASVYLLQSGIYNNQVQHHYLGLGGGPRELVVQKQIGIMDSNDSSSVFWHAIKGIPFDSTCWGLKDGKHKSEVDFNLPFDEKHVQLISKNIEYMEHAILNQLYYSSTKSFHPSN